MILEALCLDELSVRINHRASWQFSTGKKWKIGVDDDQHPPNDYLRHLGNAADSAYYRPIFRHLNIAAAGRRRENQVAVEIMIFGNRPPGAEAQTERGRPGQINGPQKTTNSSWLSGTTRKENEALTRLSAFR
jgi:hypothetical protein